MAGRPCNPDSDLKRLWRTLLPGTPFPQCGAPADTIEPPSVDPEGAATGAADTAPKPVTDR